MDLEDEETWLRARVAHLRLLMPLVTTSPAKAGFDALKVAMEKRLCALEERRARPFGQDEPPGG